MERLNPLALLLAVIPSSLAVVAWLNAASALLALALWLIVIVLTGHARALWHASIAAVLVAAATATVSMSLYGRFSGEELWRFGPALVSTGSLEIAGATALRVLAIAIPAVVAFRLIDLTRFADALEQTLRVPARWVWASFAGLRQLELAESDWHVARMARRARGLSGGNPVRRLGSGLVAVFALALERGAELTVTLHARGIDLGRRRPSRPMRWGRVEWLTVGLGAAIGVAVAVVAVAMGGSIA